MSSTNVNFGISQMNSTNANFDKPVKTQNSNKFIPNQTQTKMTKAPANNEIFNHTAIDHSEFTSSGFRTRYSKQKLEKFRGQLNTHFAKQMLN